MADIKVIGAGVGRTGTNSLKLALEQLLGGPCHHMHEILADPSQIPAWTAVLQGGTPDWPAMLANYHAIVDWPGASYWRELSATYPDALVVLSVRDAAGWYRSARDTIVNMVNGSAPPPLQGWMEAVATMLGERFTNRVDDEDAMVAAFHRHNDEVRAGVPADRLLEWTATDGWEPLCARLGLPVPAEPFPKINTTAEFRANVGLPPL